MHNNKNLEDLLVWASRQKLCVSRMLKLPKMTKQMCFSVTGGLWWYFPASPEATCFLLIGRVEMRAYWWAQVSQEIHVYSACHYPIYTVFISVSEGRYTLMDRSWGFIVYNLKRKRWWPYDWPTIYSGIYRMSCTV